MINDPRSQPVLHGGDASDTPPHSGGGSSTRVRSTGEVDTEIGARRSLGLRLALVAMDTAALTLAWLVAAAREDRVVEVGDAALFVLLGLAVMAALRMYRARVAAVWVEETRRLLRGSALVALAVAAADGMGDDAGLGAVVTLGLVMFASLLLARAMFRSGLAFRRRRGSLRVPVVLVGAAGEAMDLLDIIRQNPESGFDVVGLIGPRDGWREVDLPWLGTYDDAVTALRDAGATGVIIESAGLSSSRVTTLVHQVSRLGIHVQVSMGLRNFDARRITPRPVAREPLVYVEPVGLSRSARVTKRAIDVVGASLGLLLTAPVIAVLAFVIRLDGGPAFFAQQRVGRNGETFRLWKLRSMVVDAEERLQELRDENLRDGPLFKMAHDPRVTRVGRIMRATSLDEIPQFWNVLTGDMSLVGPRPALPGEVATFDSELLNRLAVRPGVTGLWQVEARGTPSFSAYRRLDLFYVRNWSPLLDLAVIGATVFVLARDAWQAVRGGTTDPVSGAR